MGLSYLFKIIQEIQTHDWCNLKKKKKLPMATSNITPVALLLNTVVVIYKQRQRSTKEMDKQAC